jgi:ABC-2 type transport system permease protein
MQRLRFLVWKELLELRLNPRLFGIVIMAPIIQLTMLGYAATTDVRDVPVVVADGDRSALSRELVSRFDASRNFTVIDTVSTVGTSTTIWNAAGRGWRSRSRPATNLRFATACR